MKLLTQIPISKAKEQVDYSSRLMLLGSCFSENIGDKLNYFKFQTVQNPLGILFHPLAIEKLIQRAVRQEFYSDEDVFHLNECYHCFDAHSSLSANSEVQLVTNLNTALGMTYAQLKNASHIIMTMGTAWVYQNKSTNLVVANCHKMPQHNFDKKLLDIPTIIRSCENSIALVRTINPLAQILFTVSPVRHLKDGFVENQLSKAHLISAINEVVKQEHNFYFPSYEIMMDELRDYRFYAEDMVHPNAVAIAYIWQKFCEVWVNKRILDTMNKVNEIQRGLQHRPFNPSGDAHQKFLTSIQEKISELEKTYPSITFNSPEA